MKRETGKERGGFVYQATSTPFGPRHLESLPSGDVVTARAAPLVSADEVRVTPSSLATAATAAASGALSGRLCTTVSPFFNDVEFKIPHADKPTCDQHSRHDNV